MLPICFLKKETKQNKTTTKKEKSLTQQESNLRPSMCKDNALSVMHHATITETAYQINCI